MAAAKDFRWSIPERFNIGADLVDRHASAGNETALVEVDPSGKATTFGFRDIAQLANRLANVLRAHGVERGERVAILLAQRHETAVAHVAAYKAGFVAVPLFTLFGEEALEFRLADSGARAIITDAEGVAKLERLRQLLPELHVVFCADGHVPGALDLHAALAHASDRFEAVATRPRRPPSSSTPPAPPGSPRGRSTRTACSSDTCRESSTRTTASRSRATGSGRRRTGPGSAGSTTCSFPPGITG
jgi:acetyl-CoA synthetase